MTTLMRVMTHWRTGNGGIDESPLTFYMSSVYGNTANETGELG